MITSYPDCKKLYQSKKSVIFGSLEIGAQFFVNEDDEKPHFKCANLLSREMDAGATSSHYLQQKVYVIEE